MNERAFFRSFSDGFNYTPLATMLQVHGWRIFDAAVNGPDGGRRHVRVVAPDERAASRLICRFPEAFSAGNWPWPWIPRSSQDWPDDPWLRCDPLA